MQPIGPSGDRALVHDHRVYRLDVEKGTVLPTGLDTSDRAVLEQITSFASREDHYDSLYHQLHEALTPRRIRAIVKSLEEAGFLCTEELVLTRADRGETPPAHIDWTGVIIGRDIKAIAPAIQSIVHATARDSATPVVLSFQGSISPGEAREVLVPEGADVSVHVLDRNWFSSWLMPLIADFSEKERESAIRATGLAPSSEFRAGSNRNRLLLLGAGRRIVISDDDQPSRFTWAEGAPPRLASDPNPLFYTPLETVTQRDALYRFQGEDPATLHNRWLSRDPRTIPGITLKNVSTVFTKALRAAEPRIRATAVGLAGDWGRRTPLLIAQSEPERLEEMTCRQLFSSIGVVRAPALTVTDAILFRSSHCGYDNTIVLPPFSGEGRNGDGVFGAVLSRVTTPGAIAHIPAAVEHVPKNSMLPPGALNDAGARPNDILIIATLTAQPTTLEGMAVHLEDLAALPPGQFARRFVPYLWHQRAATATRLAEAEQLVRDKTLREILSSTRGMFEESLNSADLLQPGTTWEGIRNHVSGYARLLRIWTRLWNRARREEMDFT